MVEECGQYNKVYKSGMAVGYSNDGSLQLSRHILEVLF